ncbi:hypothetical protein FQA39_LY17669 [Lamprigera yunnana]|nr:hypothetical protein FQA39_LY17669 [Lamprigera yunnana]
MEAHDGINASTSYDRRYKDLESAIGDLEDGDRQLDLTIILPSPDYETDLDDIDEDNIQSHFLPADVPGQIEVFTNDSQYDSDDNIPLARLQTINTCLRDLCGHQSLKEPRSPVEFTSVKALTQEGTRRRMLLSLTPMRVKPHFTHSKRLIATNEMSRKHLQIKRN